MTTPRTGEPGAAASARQEEPLTPLALRPALGSGAALAGSGAARGERASSQRRPRPSRCEFGPSSVGGALKLTSREPAQMRGVSSGLPRLDAHLASGWSPLPPWGPSSTRTYGGRPPCGRRTRARQAHRRARNEIPRVARNTARDLSYRTWIAVARQRRSSPSSRMATARVRARPFTTTTASTTPDAGR